MRNSACREGVGGPPAPNVQGLRTGCRTGCRSPTAAWRTHLAQAGKSPVRAQQCGCLQMETERESAQCASNAALHVCVALRGSAGKSTVRFTLRMLAGK